MRKLPNTSPAAISNSSTLGPSVAHESATKHVTGHAQYVDDIPEWPNQLHIATGKSIHAKAKIKSIDLSEVISSAGVVDVITFSDIPGDPDIAPVFSGDLLLANDITYYVGQPLFAVAADNLFHAKQAALKAKVDYEVMTPLLDFKQALKQEDFVLPTHSFSSGNLASAFQNAPHTLSSEIWIKGQEHFYLEGQISLAIPTEDKGVLVYASSQHPAEVQKLVASVLNIPIHMVQVEVRRMGGGFGGKESQAAALSCLAAIFAIRNNVPVKYRMPRQDDMVQTGKRHDFWNQYKVGFDKEGKIHGAVMHLVGKCGCSADLSDGVVDRAMYHADNAYNLNNAEITGYRCRTDTVSNTAFRGFGGPKGVILAEKMLDDIARKINEDPLDVRKINLYRKGKHQTPYGQEIEEDILFELIEQLESECLYRKRRALIKDFNSTSSWIKKGLSLTPVKFGISFTSKHLNQGGALVHIYTDGSIHVSHGGTEMGQGLNTKIALIVARAFSVDLSQVVVSATRTDKVPNSSPTAASAGTDLNGMAALNAVNKIKKSLFNWASEYYKIDKSKIRIENGTVHLDQQQFSFSSFIKTAYMERIALSATGFYKTPGIGYDRKKGKGKPFYYFANGAACSEVTVDILTGEYKVDQIDILHDVGKSINPAVDIGQIEGGFIQGMGWLTTEELLWNDQGRIISDSPANYKIPTSADVPEKFSVKLFERPNHAETVYLSKAVGEPPLMLAISVWCALRDACSSLTNYTYSPELGAPATPEQVYACIEDALAFQRGSAI